MSHFASRLYDFMYRHKRKFIFAGVFVGGVIGAAKYAEWKVKDWIEVDREKTLKDRQKLDHFQHTQNQCLVIVKSVVVSLSNEISKYFNVTEIIFKLKSEVNSSVKIDLWNELKIVVFTKLVMNVIIISFCSVFISVQLNQIAAKVFDGIENKNSPLSASMQQWYLALTHDYVIKSSMPQLLPCMKKITKDLLQTMPLQCQMSPANIEHILKTYILKIKELGLNELNNTNKVIDNYTDVKSFCSFMFPHGNNIDYGHFKDETTIKVINEMWDLIGSQDFCDVLEESLNVSFTEVADLLADKIWPTEMKEIETCHRDVPEHTTLPLAKLLPVINREIETLMTDSLMKKVVFQPMLTDFCANIFESFLH